MVFLVLDKKETIEILQERICDLLHILKAECELTGRVGLITVSVLEKIKQD